MRLGEREQLASETFLLLQFERVVREDEKFSISHVNKRNSLNAALFQRLPRLVFSPVALAIFQ